MSYDAELSKKVYNCKTVLNVELDQNNAIESKKKNDRTKPFQMFKFNCYCQKCRTKVGSYDPETKEYTLA